jgi:hypothetical protein
LKETFLAIAIAAVVTAGVVIMAKSKDGQEYDKTFFVQSLVIAIAFSIAAVLIAGIGQTSTSTAKGQRSYVESIDVILMQYALNGPFNCSVLGLKYTFAVEPQSVPFSGLIKYKVTVTAKKGNKQTFAMSVSKSPEKRHIDVFPLD